MRQAPWAQKLIRQIDRFTKLTDMEAVNTRTGFKVVMRGKGQVTMSFNGFEEVAKIKDDLENLYIWLWNVKDHMIERLASQIGAHPVAKKMVDAFVNETRDLKIVADVANTAKHGKLKRTRSGRFARIGHFVTATPIPLGREDIKIEKRHVRDDSRAFISVEDQDGKEIGDAAEIASRALSAWESFVSRHNLSGRSRG